MTNVSTSPPPPRRLRFSRSANLTILVTACLVLLAARVFEVRQREYVGPSFLPGMVLPTVCTTRAYLGISCPGCGLTRSIVYLVHGEWLASLEMHHLGWLFALIIFAQIPYRTYRIFRPGVWPVPHRIANGFWIAVAAALIGNWILGILLPLCV